MLVFIYGFVNHSIKYEWPEGKKIVYKLEFISTGESFGTSIGSIYSIFENQSVNTNISGFIHIEDVKSDESLLKISIKPAEFMYQHEKSGEVFDIKKSDIEFLIKWNMVGGFGDIFFPVGLSREYEYLAKDIISLLQIKIKDDVFLSWKSKIDTVSGSENVTYNYMPEIFNYFIGGDLSKQYITSASEKKISGIVDYTINSDQVIIDVLGNKSEEFYVDKELVSKNMKSIDLELESVSNVNDTESKVDVDDERQYRVANINGVYAKERLSKMSDLGVVAGRNYNEIISPMMSVNDLEIKDQANVYQSLAAYLRLYPSAVERVIKQLEGYTQQDVQFDILSTALGSVGTPQAQRLMVEYIENSSGREKNQVMLNLAFTNSPTSETEALYWDIFNSTNDPKEKTSSLYAIGIMTSKFDPGSERYNQSINELERVYGAANSRSDKRLAIKAIMNTRSSEFYDEMKSLIDQDDEYKILALTSLKHIKSDDSEAMLLKYSFSDEAEERFVAVNSLSSYPVNSEILERYNEILYTETNKRITKQVLNNMDTYKSDPGVQVLAVSYRASCPSDELCRLTNRIITK